MHYHSRAQINALKKLGFIAQIVFVVKKKTRYNEEKCMYEFLSFTKKSFSLIHVVLYAVKVKDISILKMIINIFVYIERLYS